ncbi:HPr(Ser) kinase/phosphatase [Peptoniphilus raoultii]|uniref:HPr(Ser) kinase/phosphatase n=1 Tax=Peptoniphilus raoultii TaxID=1776387 RepID=UPI0008DA7B65|nr:HPr(Ser) kinase/phosphatase [Peptoniphilus raoultii]
MTIKLKKIVDKLDLEILHKSTDYSKIDITTDEINRPGLQFCGHFNQFVEGRIQIIGAQEWYYLNSLSPIQRKESLESLFSLKVPCIIFTRSNIIFPEVQDLAHSYNITIIRSNDATTKLLTKLVSIIDEELAPTLRMHGCLLDIYGVGVLITGRSGIGKSETALDLISGGARLISDDSVIIKNMDDRLVGKSPEITRHFMEIRGVGIVDVQKMFGIGYVMEEKEVEIVVELVDWDESKEYDRLGLDDNYESLLGINVVKFTIPVKPGRHTALIIEVATKNFKQKELGYNPAVELNNRILAARNKNL